ncbi:hypothetical protein [Rhizobium gallicum]|uniref:hypothetical protein n=1 Tax=Rhizobium gallicum TaxID=56730 RepID=UPI001EF8CDD3|nr:hypothetical protein [Rhizobium gallicum]ULJ72535.1 hypothetical protein L2W42_02140 [Rhizobium gallicum]
MKEHKGQNAFNWRLFLGFGYGLISFFADRLNLIRPLDSLFPSFGSRTMLQCVTLMPCGFGHRMAFGSRFPILLQERSPVLPGSLSIHQDNRDIVDAPSMGFSPRGW